MTLRVGPSRLALPFLRIESTELVYPWTKRYTVHMEGQTPRMPDALRLALHHRVFDCEAYAACLHYAAVRNWPGFTCRMCRRASGLLPYAAPDGASVPTVPVEDMQTLPPAPGASEPRSQPINET